MVRFLHTADWQLGMTRHFLDAEAQGRFAQDRIDVIGRMAELATARDCAFVVVAGDVFETNQPDVRTLDRALDALCAFTMPVYLLPGNHDAYEPGSIYRSERYASKRPANVEVLDDTTPRMPVDGVEVVGAPLRNRRPISDPVTPHCVSADNPRTTRVIVGHGAVDAISGDHEPGTIRLADLEAAVTANSIAYVALGDRHSTTNVGSTGRIWYAGAPEPTDYDEDNPGNALIVTLGAAPAQPVEVDAVAVSRWAFRVVDRDVTELADVEALLADLDAIDDKARTVVKVRVSGMLTLTQASALDAGLEARSDAFGALEAPERHRDIVIRPDDADLADVPLPGYLASVRDTLLEQSQGSGDDAEVARDALGLLLRFAGSSRT